CALRQRPRHARAPGRARVRAVDGRSRAARGDARRGCEGSARMTALLVVGCAILGFVAGWLADPVITRVPLRQPVGGPAGPDVHPTPRPRRLGVAILCGALCGAVAGKYDDTWVLPAYLVVTVTLVVLAVIDLEHFLLPNKIVYPLGFVSIALFALAAVGDDNWDAYTRGLLAG